MKADNYGDVLAFATGNRVLAYEEFGSYQGDYVAVLFDGREVSVWKGSYGSCSGCDWLQAESRNFGYDREDDIPDEVAKEYVRDFLPFIVLDLPKLRTVLASDDIRAYFPANTRQDYDDWNWTDLRRILAKAMEEIGADEGNKKKT